MSYRPKVRDLIQSLLLLGYRPVSNRGRLRQKWRTPSGVTFFVVLRRPHSEVGRAMWARIRRILRKEHRILDGKPCRPPCHEVLAGMPLLRPEPGRRTMGGVKIAAKSRLERGQR